MSLYVTAQFIGLIGYLLYVIAPYFNTQIRIVQIGLLACTVLCAQWYLLGQYSLCVMNVLMMCLSLCTLYKDRIFAVRRFMWLFYPFGTFALISAFSGSIIDLIVLSAFLLNIRAHMSQDLLDFRNFSFLAGILLTCSGGLALSIPAVIFNFVFAFGHIRGMRALYSMGVDIDRHSFS